MMQGYSLVAAICGQCNPCGVQQQLKFTLTKILATVKKLIGHFNHSVVTL